MTTYGDDHQPEPGSDEASGTPSGSGSSSTPASAPGSAPSSAPSSSDTPSSGGGGAVLGPVSDVPVGGGKVFDKVVVTQPTAGQFRGFTAVCTHAGCLVRTVENNTINCPCHGSKYSATDGSVVRGPAPAPLAAINVTVQNGNILGPA